MSNFKMEMPVDSICPVCKKVLKKGQKFHSLHGNGGKIAYVCSSKCNKKFNEILDGVFDVYEGKGGPYPTKLIKEFEETYNYYTLKNYSFQFETWNGYCTCYNVAQFYSYVCERLHQGLTPIEIATDIFSYLIEMENIENE